MRRLTEEQFEEFWEQTKLVRIYQPSLTTFISALDMDLPYLFLAQHPKRNRVFVKKGVIYIKKPIVMALGLHGKSEPIYYSYNCKPSEESLDYGYLAEVTEKYLKEMEKSKDKKTGLITGKLEGYDISLARYPLEVITLRFTPEKIQERTDYNKRYPLD